MTIDTKKPSTPRQKKARAVKKITLNSDELQIYSIKDLKMWIAGIKTFLGKDWHPTQDQWEKILLVINNISEENSHNQPYQQQVVQHKALPHEPLYQPQLHQAPQQMIQPSVIDDNPTEAPYVSNFGA